MHTLRINGNKPGPIAKIVPMLKVEEKKAKSAPDSIKKIPVVKFLFNIIMYVFNQKKASQIFCDAFKLVDYFLHCT